MSKELAIATILKTGPGSSIQDLGRWGFANIGIPVSGAMDKKSLEWINHILQNETYNAVLEISQPGFVIEFDSDTILAIAGAEANLLLNGNQLINTSLIQIKAKDKLEIGAFIAGARVYIGVRFGFKTPKVLGSRSFYTGITENSYFSKGDKIKYFIDKEALPVLNAKPRWMTSWFETEEMKVYPGPDFHLLPKELKEKLINQSFRISQQSNRMGIQLLELLENDLSELPTNPVFPGMVQLTSGGKLIILGQDAQVTGGYPRILQFTSEALNCLAQKKPGNKIRFTLIQV